MDKEEKTLWEIPRTIYDKIDFALSIPRDNAEDLKEATEEVITNLSKLISNSEILKTREQQVELFYLLGYSLYIHPERRLVKEIYEKTETALWSAIQLDPDYGNAWLYLGHNAYDMENYEAAQQRFNQIKEEQVTQFLWLKALEMRVCCSIWLKGLTKTLDEIEEFVSEVEKRPDAVIAHLNLYQVLKACDNKLGIRERGRMTRLAIRLDRTDYFISFTTASVADEIHTLFLDLVNEM